MWCAMANRQHKGVSRLQRWNKTFPHTHTMNLKSLFLEKNTAAGIKSRISLEQNESSENVNFVCPLIKHTPRPKQLESHLKIKFNFYFGTSPKAKICFANIFK